MISHEHQGVSDHCKLDSLFNSMLRPTKKEDQRSTLLDFYEENPPVTVNSHHKGLVMCKAFLRIEVIMQLWVHLPAAPAMGIAGCYHWPLINGAITAWQCFAWCGHIARSHKQPCIICWFTYKLSELQAQISFIITCQFSPNYKFLPHYISSV